MISSFPTSILFLVLLLIVGATSTATTNSTTTKESISSKVVKLLPVEKDADAEDLFGRLKEMDLDQFEQTINGQEGIKGGGGETTTNNSTTIIWINGTSSSSSPNTAAGYGYGRVISTTLQLITSLIFCPTAAAPSAIQWGWWLKSVL